ncbi:MAG TPA: protein kinase, partial [Thermoanaerobaculia bacterium]|nr:protein kinase [Thermoanaerobaculia bacterium]
MAALSQTIGPYILEKRLGAGGMGEVYQAYDSRLDRRVAIKLIRPEQTENETARERFRREARAAAGLSHPSIVQIHDIVETGESDAIVMELV